jgi:PAS domain-containing protein
MLELSPFFKSIIDQDTSMIVICNLKHEMIYMNPEALKHFGPRGGSALIGKSLFDCHNPNSVEKIQKVVEWFEESKEHNIMFIKHNDALNKDQYMVALRDEDGTLIGYYEKHDFRNLETAVPYDFGK